MKPRFQADADFNQKIIAGLRRREPAIDFQTALQGDVIACPDPEVLLLAARQGRIVVTHDRRSMPAHFSRFVETHDSPGLIVVSQELDIAAVMDDLLLIWAASDSAEWQGKIGFVPI
ncbi:MAG: DUF5615 family PIN-like protein [Terriglobia bacterium]